MKIRVPARCWEYAQIIDIDGTVSLCSWCGNKIIGKLTENSMYDIWHGAEAEKYRESFRDGSYRYCDKEHCQYLANDTMEELMCEYDDVTEYPLEVSIAYENQCNYSCLSCVGHSDWRQKISNPPINLEKIHAELSKFMNKVKRFGANGRGELFASPDILEILSKWSPEYPVEQVSAILETNGSLFNKKNWKKISNLGKYNLSVAVTVMSFEEFTYQFLSGTNLPVQNVIDNLQFIKTLREKNIINTLELATVVQERNFREMPEFTRRCLEEFGADIVRMRPYYPWAGMGLSPAEQWFFDVRNPSHPYYQEYVKVFSNDIFKNEKVYNWSGNEASSTGDLRTYLANHGWPIGVTNAPPQSTPPEALKDRANYEVIKVFAVEEKMPAKLAKYFLLHRIHRVAVHGLSFVAHAFLEAMEKTDIEVDRILDKRLCGCPSHGLTVSCVEDLPRDYAVPIIVTAPFYFEEIKREIEGRVPYPCILNIKDIVAEVGCSIA